MTKIFNASILIMLFIYCTGFEKEDESKLDPERIIERAKELKSLRKGKRLKESNHRKALENILSSKNSDGYRSYLEELLKNSTEKSQVYPHNHDENVVLQNPLIENENNDKNDMQPAVETVIEHLTETVHYNETESTTATLDVTESDLDINQDTESVPLERKGQDTTFTAFNNNEDNRNEKNGIYNFQSAVMQTLPSSYREERYLEPFDRFRVEMPTYPTVLTRNGMVLSPLVYTIPSSLPISDHIGTQNQFPNYRRTGTAYFTKTDIADDRLDPMVKSIDDYSDYNKNNYLYSPTRRQEMFREADVKVNILSKSKNTSVQSFLRNPGQYRRDLYHSPYFSQNQQYPGNYRLLFGR